MKTWKLFNKKKDKQQRFVLCIDGGGMRGVIPVRILTELANCLEKNGRTKKLSSYFDLIAGTSTGGLIALALSCTDQSLAQLTETYKTIGNKIFKAETNPLTSVLRTFTAEKYSIDGLTEVLKQWFGDKTLSCASTKTMVMAYDLLKGKEAPFCSWKDTEVKIRDAARATSAAPTYFKPLSLNNKLLVDGGVIANNPSLYSLIQAKEMWPDCSKLTVLSIGTAANIHTMNSDATHTIISWAENVIPMFLNAQKRTVDTILKSTEGVNYIRIEAPLTESIRLDDYSDSAIKIMSDHAENLAIQSREILEKLATEIAKSKR